MRNKSWERKKLENQKISNDNAENVAGGVKFHVDNTTPFAKIDTLYLSEKEYSAFKKAGVIDKNNTFNMSNLKKVPENSELHKLISKENLLLTTAKARPWEHEVKISNSKDFLE